MNATECIKVSNLFYYVQPKKRFTLADRLLFCYYLIMSNDSPKLLTDRYNHEVADFFNTEIIEINVKFYETWQELSDKFTDLRKEKNPPKWLSGFANDRTVHILSPEVMSARREDSGTTRFKKILKHEIAHFYVSRLNDDIPAWLNEGISCWLANQNKDADINPTVALLKALDHEYGKSTYDVGRFMVSKIVDTFGKERLFDIIRIKDREARYEKLKEMFDWLR